MSSHRTCVQGAAGSPAARAIAAAVSLMLATSPTAPALRAQSGAPAPATTASAPRGASVDLLASLPATWVRGAAGAPSVTGRAGVGVGASWHRPVDAQTAVGVGARAAWSSVAATRGGERWAEGSEVTIAAVALLAWQASSRVGTSLEAGVAHVAGPRDLAPFADRPALQPAAAATLTWAIAADSPWRLLLRADWLRAGGAGGDDPVETAGSVRRVSAGVRWTP